jgi:hypothetical protein
MTLGSPSLVLAFGGVGCFLRHPKTLATRTTKNLPELDPNCLTMTYAKDSANLGSIPQIPSPLDALAMDTRRNQT